MHVENYRSTRLEEQVASGNFTTKKEQIYQSHLLCAHLHSERGALPWRNEQPNRWLSWIQIILVLWICSISSQNQDKLFSLWKVGLKGCNKKLLTRACSQCNLLPCWFRLQRCIMLRWALPWMHKELHEAGSNGTTKAGCDKTEICSLSVGSGRAVTSSRMWRRWIPYCWSKGHAVKLSINTFCWLFSSALLSASTRREGVVSSSEAAGGVESMQLSVRLVSLRLFTLLSGFLGCQSSSIVVRGLVLRALTLPPPLSHAVNRQRHKDLVGLLPGPSAHASLITFPFMPNATTLLSELQINTNDSCNHWAHVPFCFPCSQSLIMSELQTLTLECLQWCAKIWRHYKFWCSGYWCNPENLIFSSTGWQ